MQKLLRGEEVHFPVVLKIEVIQDYNEILLLGSFDRRRYTDWKTTMTGWLVYDCVFRITLNHSQVIVICDCL